MHKNFSFKGLVRSNDNILVNDGECLELVNLRMVNGSLKPVPEPVEVAVLSSKYSKIYWHDMASCYICVSSDSYNSVDFYDSEWNLMVDNYGYKLNFSSLEKVKSIEFVGYIVVFMTENGIRYIIYGNGTYRWLGEFPPIPDFSVSLFSKIHVVTTETAFTKSNIDTDISSTWEYNSRGYFDECISMANKSGYYVDRALFKFALRLYDGSYIYTSHVICASDESNIDGVLRDGHNLTAFPVSSTNGETCYKVKVLAFKPMFVFSNLDLGNWEGIVAGIDVFTTGSIMGKKIGTATTTLYDTVTKQRTTEKYEVYIKKELDELWNDINNASLFYKIAEFDINGNLLSAVDDVSHTNVVLQEALSSFEQTVSCSSVVPDCSYVFNNRLHIASLREYFFKGYGSSSLLPVCGDTAVVDKIAVMTRIKTQNGVSEVVNAFYNVRVGYKNGTFQLPPLLMYPDSRAFEMRLFIVYDTETFMKCLPLSPHKFLNQAQYLHKRYMGYDVTLKSVFASGREVSGISKSDVLELFNNVTGVHEVVYSAEKGGWTYNGSSFPPEKYSSLRIFQIPRDIANGDKLVFTITVSNDESTFIDIDTIPFDDTWKLVGGSNNYRESNIFEQRDNILKVSMVDNPFIFPAKCTYPLSQGKIVALSTNRTAMSEGQFGEHPLYVFSKNGIGVMSVDSSGATAYSNVYPVSHEICQNCDTICATDSGVLFWGAQGVMMINGNRCVKLSTAMDNDLKELETIGGSGVIGRIASVFGLNNVVGTSSFTDFMRDSKAARFSEMDEIVFCNAYYNYSLVYSLASNTWSKLSNAFYGFVRSTSAFIMFRHNSNKTYVNIPGNNLTGKNSVMLVTRPHMFGTKLPKRIMQLMLHAYFSKPSTFTISYPFLSCFLLCSNDGVHFKLVAGCERKNDTQDVVFPYFPTCSYRYYIFALTGYMNSKSMITSLEIDVDAAWNNRLR